jgi:hypothetical protein
MKLHRLSVWVALEVLRSLVVFYGFPTSRSTIAILREVFCEYFRNVGPFGYEIRSC